MTVLECAAQGCGECQEKVKQAHRFEPNKPKLHEPAHASTRVAMDDNAFWRWYTS